MAESETVQPERSYGCTFGCGNPYDYVVISVADGSTEFLCLPCYVRLATDLVEAVTNPEGQKVIDALRESGTVEQAPMSGSKPKSRGRNAPVTNDDPDIFEEFDGVVTEDELPDEFR